MSSLRRPAAVLVLAAAVLVTSAAAAPAADPLAWQPCAGAPAGYPARCATVLVPGGPGAPPVGLRVAVLPAAQPAERIGVLVVNPGGPGSSSADLVSKPDLARAYFPQQLLDRFDLVEVDGRGIGGSAPVSCAQPPHDPAATRFPTDQADLARLAASNARFARSCRGASVSAMDTVTNADDLDAVRAALGVDRISFLGLSYGTMLAQVYAERHGTHVRAMVVDGVIDRSVSWRDLALADTRAVQDGFEQFAAWCGPAPECGRDAHRLVAELLAAADRGELAGASAEELAAAVDGGLGSPRSYPVLAEALIAAHDRHAPAQLMSLAPWASAAQDARYRAIVCQDIPVPDLEPADTARARAAGPALRGDSEFWQIASGCVGWPDPVRWQPHPWRVPPGFPGALVVTGAHDVSTPRAFALSVATQFPGARLRTWDGIGHTAWFNDPPTRAAEAAYLITGR